MSDGVISEREKVLREGLQAIIQTCQNYARAAMSGKSVMYDPFPQVGLNRTETRMWLGFAQIAQSVLNKADEL